MTPDQPTESSTRLFQLADMLARHWQACQSVPVERRCDEDERYLDARESFLVFLDERGIDRDAFVRAVS